MIKKFNYGLSLTHGAGALTATTTPAIGSSQPNGLLRAVNFTTPATVDASATATIQLIDTDGYTVYTTASGVAANTRKVDIPTSPIPIAQLATIQVTFSAAQTATNSVTNVVLQVEI